MVLARQMEPKCYQHRWKIVSKKATNWLKSQKNAIRKHIPKRIPNMYDFVVEMAPRTECLGPSKIMKNRLGDQRCSKEASGCHLDTILVWFWGAISTCFRCVLHHVVIMCAGLPSQCLLLGLSLKTHCWKRIGWFMDEFCWSRLLVLSCPFIWFWQVFLRSSLTLMLLLLGILQYSLRFCTTCFYVFVVTASSNNRLDDASGDRSQNQAAAFRFLSSQVTESSAQLIVVLYN